MASPLLDTLRFGRGWLRPPPSIRTREVRVRPGDDASPVPATLMERADTLPAPGWVVLHGLTRPGRHHASLVRFSRALASTGGRVLIPEIPEWVELDFAPERAQAIIRGAVERLAGDPDTRGKTVTLVGFSFGAPQALLAASDPGFSQNLRAVVGWGGYGDLTRTSYFQLTGEHEWQGTTYHQPPDPYGRWIVGANCLPLLDEVREAAAVARALQSLAREAGDRQIDARHQSLDGLKRQLRMGLPSGARALFDLFAPPTHRQPDPQAARRMVERIVPAVRRAMPLMDPLRMIESIQIPVRLLHSRSDHLIPFTETLRTADALRRRAPLLEAEVTGLFQHSGRPEGGSLLARARALMGFAGALKGMFEATAPGPSRR